MIPQPSPNQNEELIEVPEEEVAQLGLSGSDAEGSSLEVVDLLAPENLDAYIASKEDEEKNPGAGFLSRTGSAMSDWFESVGTGIKLSAQNAMNASGSVMLQDSKLFKESVRKQTALTAQATAYFGTSFAQTGENILGSFKEVGTKLSVGYKDTPENRRKVYAVKQANDRALKTLEGITDDALAIADYVVPGMDLTHAYSSADRPEMMKGAAGVAEFIDTPFTFGAGKAMKLTTSLASRSAAKAERIATTVGAEKVAELINSSRSFVNYIPDRLGEIAAQNAGKKIPNLAALADAGKRMVALQEERLIIEAAEESADRAKALANNSAKIAEVRDHIEKLQSEFIKRADELALDAASKPVSQKITGTVIEGTGKAMTAMGETVQEGLDWLKSKRAAALGSTDEAVEFGDAVAEKVTGISPSVAERTAQYVSDFGKNVSAAGRLMRTMESSTPYFQRLAKETDGWTRFTAQNANRVEFVSRIGRGIGESIDGAVKGGAYGAAIGFMQGDSAEGLGEGIIGGFFGGNLRTISLERDPNVVRARQIGDIADSRSRRTKSQQQVFDSAPRNLQLAAATFEATNPNLTISFVNEKGGGGSYRVNPDGTGEVRIDLDSSIPLVPLLAHEVSHHISRNPDIASDLKRRFLGDEAAGQPGYFTEFKDGKLQPTEEFSKFRGEYLQKLKDAGKDTSVYEENPELILHEVIAEASVSSLLATNAANEFAGIGALRKNMRPLAKLVDLFAKSPTVMNSSVLQRALMATGAVFTDNGAYAKGTGLFETDMSPKLRSAVGEMVKKYDQMNLDERGGQIESFAESPTIYSDKEIVANPELMDLVSSGFDVDYDPKTGKRTFLSASEAKKREQSFMDDLLLALEASPDLSPGRVRAELTRDGRTIYTGKYVPADVLEALAAKNKHNPRQLEMLRMITEIFKKNPGNEAHFVYQPALTRESKVYKQRSVTNRVETPISIVISRTGGILINTLSQEKVLRNLEFFSRKGLLEPWNGDIRAARADVYKYAENTSMGRDGAEGLDLDKRDVLNALFGQLTKTQRERNPVLQGLSEKQARKIGVVQSRRLDRINQLKVLDSEFKTNYGRIAENLRPEENTGTQESGKPTLKTVTRDVSDNSEFVSPPSDEALRAGMQKAHGTKPGNKAEKIGAARDLVPGTPVDLRIDIPTFNATEKEGEPVYAVTVHERGIGKVLGYDSIAAVDNPTFRVREKASEAIRDGASKSPIAVVQGQFNPSREIPQDINDWTAVGFDPKDHSYFYDKTTDQPVIGGKQAISVGNTVFVKDPMYGDRSQFQYRPESPQKRTVSDREDSPQFRPETNAETERVAAKYMKTRGVPYTPHTEYDAAPESQLKRIADYFENEAKHEPTNPEVRASYDALADETLAQYRAMERAGIKIEPFSGEGEPYKSSADMMADVRDNKHLFFFLTDKAFGEGEQQSENALTQKSGVRVNGTELLFNDLFRAVHDYFGHTARGFEFGPRGEFNAWKSHSKMFSDEAQGALAAETLAQNAWVNFGPHLRGKDGAIPKKGEEGFISPKDRPFAEQKNFIVPPEYIQFRPDNPVEVETEQIKQTTVTEPIKADPEGFIGKFITKNYGLPTIVIGKNKSSSVPIISFNKYISVEVKPSQGPLKGTVTTLADAHAPTVKQYAGLSSQTYKERDKGKAIESAVNDMKDNLLFLHDLAAEVYGKDVVERMSKWYDGANVIARKFAEKYGVSVPQAAAVLAAMSPQKHWFANVSLAENIMDVMRNHQDTVFSPEVEEAARADIERSTGSEESKVVLYEKIDSISGKRLSELTDPIEKAMFVRFLSQKIHPTQSYLVTPEGGLTPEAGVTVAWSGNSATMNAISAFEDGSVLGLSRALGGGHKVRNFYGNIIDPSSPLFYTSDTHNVAASLLLPLAGTDYEVAHNFGSNPKASSKNPILPVIGTTKSGLKGTYSLYFEAGRRAAAERGVLPRQMQSITWEMVRLMFTDDMKTDAFKASIKQVHAQVRSGKLTIDQARNQIVELSGGLDGIKARPPAWINQ